VFDWDMSRLFVAGALVAALFASSLSGQQAAPPTAPSDKPEEIVLGNQDDSPTYSGPAPEPIENQFGTSMTATLKALSETSMNAIPKDEVVEVEEKKGGLLSRFRRS